MIRDGTCVSYTFSPSLSHVIRNYWPSRRTGKVFKEGVKTFRNSSYTYNKTDNIIIKGSGAEEGSFKRVGPWVGQ